MKHTLGSSKLAEFSPAAAFFLVLTTFLFEQWVGLEILRPTNVGWLMQYDYTAPFAALNLFRNSDFEFPIGRILRSNFPVGGNVIFLDGNLAIQLLVKPLSPFLPSSFQPFGCWVFICLYLQFFAAFWSLRHMGCGILVCFWGSILIGLLPTFYFRLVPLAHLSLLAHFLIIFAWGIYFSIRLDDRVKFRALLLITEISLFIHFYFMPPILAIALLQATKPYRADPNKKAFYEVFKRVFALASSLAVLMFITGYFDGTSSLGGGLGSFSMNLNAPINPMLGASGVIDPIPVNAVTASSRFVDPLPVHYPQQREGYQYLGLGLIIFFLVAVKLLKSATLSGIDRPTGWLLALLLAFSLSHKWYLGNGFIYGLNPPWILLKPFFALRSSGRFFWFVIYPILLITIRNTARSRSISKPRLAIVASACIAIQAMDISPMFVKKFAGSASSDLSKSIGYNLSKALKEQGFEGPIFIFETDDGWLRAGLFAELSYFFRDNKKVSISPAYTARDSVEYQKRDHLSDTLGVGGVALTRNCTGPQLYDVKELWNGWCILFDGRKVSGALRGDGR